MREPVTGVWLGTSLSKLEQTGISSFLYHDHPFILYTYNKVYKVPDGVELRDANEIIPNPDEVMYKDRPVPFADLFRYKYLYERGGWWSDLDMVLQVPLEFDRQIIIAKWGHHDRQVTPAITKIPKGSDFAYELYQRALKRVAPTYYARGHKTFRWTVLERGLEKTAYRYQIFCPIFRKRFMSLLTGSRKIESTSIAVHFWGSTWEWSGVGKNDTFDGRCIFERMKRKYL